MVWKPIGLIMILPTLVISIVIAWRTRRFVSELYHNLAVCSWICANSYWMVSEFFHFDDKVFIGKMLYKQLAIIPFAIGILILGYYYLHLLRKPGHKNERIKE